MSRSVPEWIGKRPESMPRPDVRQRILERAGEVCHICGGAITKSGWHADHVVPIRDGGENRESNIKPAHPICHRKRTAEQAMERAPIERKKMKDSGAIASKQTIKSRGFPTSQHKAKREPKPALPPRPLYQTRG